MAAAGGLALALAFEPVALAACAPVGMLMIYLAVDGLLRARDAFAVGGVAGVLFFGLLLSWLWPSVGPAAWVALSLAQAGWLAVWALGVHIARAIPLRPLMAALLWTTVETARGTWPWGGMPWGRLGFSVVDSPWSALLPYVGVTGAGFVLALTGCVVGAACLRTDLRLASRLLLSAAAVTASLAPAVIAWAPTSDDVITVALVQGDVPGDGRTLSRFHREVTASHVALTQRLAEDVRAGNVAPPDLVIWPENSTAVDPFADSATRSGIEAATQAVEVPVLVGAIVDGETEDTASNQSILWVPEGPTAERYVKRHLVPFGEYIPFRPLLGHISSRLEAISRDMIPGGSTEPLRVSGTQIATALCFDVGYDDVLPEQVRRGATIAVVQTSNAMFTGTSQLEQQFAMSRVRAIESGRTVVVASVNGVSGVIDGRGRVVERLPVRQAVSRVVEVQLNADMSPAVRYGAWVTRTLILLGLVSLVAGASLGLRQPSGSREVASRAR